MGRKTRLNSAVLIYSISRLGFSLRRTDLERDDLVLIYLFVEVAIPRLLISRCFSS